MSTYQNKTPGNKNQSFSAENTSAETDDNLFEYLDESPVAVAQRKLKDIADNSPKPVKFQNYNPLQIRSLIQFQFLKKRQKKEIHSKN